MQTLYDNEQKLLKFYQQQIEDLKKKQHCSLFKKFDFEKYHQKFIIS
ncbi:MAG: hypothetical protein ACRYGR_01010 [Janthinobacterium lividum]